MVRMKGGNYSSGHERWSGMVWHGMAWHGGEVVKGEGEGEQSAD